MQRLHREGEKKVASCYSNVKKTNQTSLFVQPAEEFSLSVLDAGNAHAWPNPDSIFEQYAALIDCDIMI